MTGQIQMWTDTSLTHLNLAAIAANELERISLSLWNKPWFTVAEEVVCDIPLPMKATGDESDPYELDWDLIYADLKLPRTRGHCLFLSCAQDVYLADSQQELQRIGFNTHWLTKHASGRELERVLRGLIRHEVGHWVISNPRGTELLHDAEVDALLKSDWTVADQAAFDARHRSLERAEDQRLIDSSGPHCLQPGCIMRQRGSIYANLGFAEIADSDYCDLCRSTVADPSAITG